MRAVDEEAERFTAIYDACRRHVWAYAVTRAGRQTAWRRAGRSGIGPAARGVVRCSCWNKGTVFGQVVVLEPGTYRLLGRQRTVVRAGGRARGMAPGTVPDHSVIRSMGGTDGEPEKP